jgi:hypothetical protein
LSNVLDNFFIYIKKSVWFRSQTCELHICIYLDWTKGLLEDVRSGAQLQ